MQIADETITSDVTAKEPVVMEYTLEGTPEQKEEMDNLMPDLFTGNAYDAQGNVVAELVNEKWINLQ